MIQQQTNSWSAQNSINIRSSMIWRSTIDNSFYTSKLEVLTILNLT